MKRKLLNGLLLISALAGVGTLQSCKDNEEDFRNEWRQENLSLQDQINLLNKHYDELKQAHKECKELCDQRFKDLYELLGAWDPKTQGTIADAIKALQGKKDCNCMTPEELEAFIKNLLIQSGWPVDAEGNPATIDLDKFNHIAEAITDIAKFQSTLDFLEDNLEGLEGLLNGDLEQRIKDLEDQLKNLNPGSNWTEEQIRALAEDEARKQLDAYKIVVTQLLSDLRVEINNNYTDLSTRIDNLLNLFNSLEVRLTAAENNALTALAQAETNRQALENITNVLLPAINGSISALENRMETVEFIQTQHTQAIADIRADVANLQTAVEDLQNKYNDLDARFNDLAADLASLTTQVNTNTGNIAYILQVLPTLATSEQLNQLAGRVSQCEDDILALQGDVNKLFKLYDRLNRMVTSIIVQGVVNPIFGSFNLPIGVQSNMLLSPYGYYSNVKDLTFPAVGNTTTNPMLTEAEAQTLAGLYTPVVIKNGEFLMDNDGKLGKVYLTLNPTNVNLSGVNLTLEKSNGEASAVLLQNVRPSYEVINFGASRTAENGFYEADAVLPRTSAAINATQIHIEAGLKSAVKDFAKDPKNKSNLFGLMRALYDQVAPGLPAFGVKSAWTVDDGQGAKTYATFSNYNVMATTFKPLSFNTYRGESINHRFNHHGPIGDVKQKIEDLIKRDRFHFSLKTNININAEDFNFTFALHDVQIDDLRYDGVLWATSPSIEIYDENGNVIGHTGELRFPVDGADIQDFLDDITSQIEYSFNEPGGMIDIWNQQLKENFDDAIGQLIESVNNEVNNALSELEGSINEQLDNILSDLIDDISGKTQGWVDRLNRFLDKYNKVVDIVNDFLADPNHYLQVTALYYTGSGNLHRLSQLKSDPTWLRNDGGNGVTIFVTSRSAELVAPAYKKFVAITAGWDSKGNTVSTSEIRSINKSGSLCQVLPGRAKRIGLPVKSLKKGYTYEIVYTALDYHGYTSTERFYVYIKE